MPEIGKRTTKNMGGIKTNNIRQIPFEQEWIITASRSSGPGGQHVNKTSTKIELRFHIPHSELLNEEEKTILLHKLKNKINIEGELIIVAQEERSQYKNKEIAIERFFEMVTKALTPTKKRKATSPSSASIEKRLEEKKLRAEKKRKRKKPDIS